MIRVLIVDDEPLARLGIQNQLMQVTDVEVVGEAGNGREAVKAIRQKRPDLVFLDIQMPLLDGFGVVESLAPDGLPAIVFVTAFDEHAIEAFEVNALDYLLKPVDPDRFQKTLQRVRARIAQSDTMISGEKLLGLLRDIGADKTENYISRFAIRDAGRIYFVDVRDIEWISAEGNYVGLHSNGRMHLTRYTMDRVSAKLDPAAFVRIRRSAIISISEIKELHPMQNGEYDIVLTSGTTLTSSRRYRGNLDRVLGN
jgi:two-component system LytT family response regulator